MSTLNKSIITYKCSKINELSNIHYEIWNKIILENSQFRSPFFTHEYHNLIKICGQNVWVGLILKNNQVVGFFPFEYYQEKKARPVGSIFCDYQGVIISPNIEWSVLDLLNTCNIKEYYFDHQLLEQSQWKEYMNIQDKSWSINLKDGFNEYEKLLKSQKRKQLKEAKKKKRMLENEIGKVEFESHINNEKLLFKLLKWKSDQWAKSGWTGRFKAKWEKQLMKKLMNTQTKSFGGLLSVLMVEKKPIAMHIGLYSKNVWHYWTTAYDPKYKKYSPGIIMLVEMIKCANNLGFNELDMGKETFEYKKRLHTHIIQLCEGKINL